MIKGCEGCKELFVHWGDVGLRTTFKSTSRDRVIRTKAMGRRKIARPICTKCRVKEILQGLVGSWEFKFQTASIENVGCS